MSRRKRPARRKANRSSCKRRKTHPNGTALLILDQHLFVKKALTKCRRLRTELRKKQERLAQFEEVEINAYNRWLNSHFGVDLTRIREMQEEEGDLEFIVGQLRMCLLCRPDKLKDIYEELFRRKKEGTLHLFEPPEPEEEDDDEDEDPMDQELRDVFDSVFEDIFGDEEDWEDEEFEGSDFQKAGYIRTPARPTNHQEAGPLKTLFRTLAKRLHPDHSELEEGIRDRRWNELQTAYREGDLEGLQRIEAVCDMDETGLKASLGLARLNDLAAYHQSHLRPIRQALREAKRHIAFDFSQEDTTQLADEIRRDFTHLQADLKERQDWLLQSAEEFLEEATRLENWNQAAADDPFDDLFDVRPATPPASSKKASKIDSRQMQFF